MLSSAVIGGLRPMISPVFGSIDFVNVTCLLMVHTFWSLPSVRS